MLDGTIKDWTAADLARYVKGLLANDPSMVPQDTQLYSRLNLDAAGGFGLKNQQGGIVNVLNPDGTSDFLFGTSDFLFSVMGVPVAGMVDYGGASDPNANWLICDGRSLLRTSYPTCFTNLGGVGSPWGIPDGTHFNLPDYRGKGSIGAGAGSGLTPRSLGTSGGEENHTITTAELAAHTHIQDAHTHTQDAHTHTQNAHAHGPSNGSVQFAFTQAIAQVAAGAAFAAINDFSSFTSNTTATNQNTTATNQNTTATNQNAGSGTAHNNMQPWLAANRIIRVL